jgi:hypothetical protein
MLRRCSTEGNGRVALSFTCVTQRGFPREHHRPTLFFHFDRVTRAVCLELSLQLRQRAPRDSESSQRSVVIHALGSGGKLGRNDRLHLCQLFLVFCPCFRRTIEAGLHVFRFYRMDGRTVVGEGRGIALILM